MATPYQSQQSAGPSALFIVLGILIIGVGVTSFIFMIYNTVTKLGDVEPLIVPGEHRLELDEVGTYDIFLEYNSVIDGEVYSNPQGVPGLTFLVRVAETGTEVPVARPNANLTYNLGSRSGSAILNFTIDEPGTYLLSATYSTEAGPPAVITVIHEFGQGLLTSILGGIAILMVCLGLGLAMIIIVAVKRHKAKRSAAQTLRMQSPWHNPSVGP